MLAHPALLVSAIRLGRLDDARWCGRRLLPFEVFVTLGAFWSRARAMGLQRMLRSYHLLSLGTLFTQLSVELM